MKTPAPLADLGFLLTVEGPDGFTVTHPKGHRVRFERAYHPDIARTVSVFVAGIEIGMALAQRGPVKP